MTSEEIPLNNAGADTSSAKEHKPTNKKWLPIVIAGIAGLALGGGIGYGVTQSQLSAAQTQLNETQGQLEVVTASEAQLKSERDAVAAAETQLSKDKAAAEADAKARAEELDQREADLDVREAAISADEAAHEAAKFGNGTHRVGVDIAAGTYRAPGGQACYWERLRGTTGSFEDIIGQGYGDGAQVVTIEESDTAFKSDGCGTWEPVP